MFVLLTLSGCPLVPHDDQPGDCAFVPTSSPKVALGQGGDGFASVVEGDALPIEYGSQGGAHVWMAVRAGGFEAPVSVAFVATDAFTGAVVASGDEQPALNARTGADGLECERHRLYLYLESATGEGAGLVDVTVTVSDAAGRRAADTRRVWLGRRMPACLPADATALTPLLVASPWLVGAHDRVIEQDARLKAINPGEPRAFLFGAATRGLAASAAALEVSLLDPEGSTDPIVSGRADGDSDPWMGRPQGQGDDCYLPVTVPLQLPEQWQGTPMLLRVIADDGLGGRVVAERRVTLDAADAP